MKKNKAKNINGEKVIKGRSSHSNNEKHLNEVGISF